MPRANTKILVVEDDSDTQFVVSFALLNAGYNVHSAATRDVALQIVPHLLPDLVIMDFRMEGMGFVEFIASARKISPGLHFVLLSANAPEKAKRYNVKYWLQKPFELVDLESVVAACLQGGSSALMPAVNGQMNAP